MEEGACSGQIFGPCGVWSLVADKSLYTLNMETALLKNFAISKNIYEDVKMKIYI